MTILTHITANTARDLSTFSAHAGRKIINTDDVMLLTRRNDALETMLKGELERMRAAEGRGEGQVVTTGKKKGRPSGAGGGATKGKGKGKA